MSSSPIQKILFGSPGTGKSYKITGESTEDHYPIKEQLGINDPRNIIKTVFHPEYTYGDFIGKLLPQTTSSNSVIYKYYPGYFLKALGRAYRNIIDGNNDNVLLVIDELNRGNAPAIFGIVFQLLDRNNLGWSEYDVNLSKLEIVGLLESMDYKVSINNETIMIGERDSNSSTWRDFYKNFKSHESVSDDTLQVLENLNNQCISIPPNLSIVTTINTSDESIYYLDSAFKRRWDWEYIEAPHGKTKIEDIPESIRTLNIYLNPEDEGVKLNWAALVISLNEFIKSNSKFIKRIEDKQIGWWFISPNEEDWIDINLLKNKLMFYLWDSVFSRDKRPLQDFLKSQSISLITYGDFVNYTEEFIFKIYDAFGGKEKEKEIFAFQLKDIPFF